MFEHFQKLNFKEIKTLPGRCTLYVKLNTTVQMTSFPHKIDCFWSVHHGALLCNDAQ